MCGIAGIATKIQSSRSDISGRLNAMAQSLVHRGPDDSGVYVSPSGRAGLANRRLAIRDVSPAGRMPMSSGDDLWITYNGEIYNVDELRPELECMGFTFHSGSDTEVILHGYEAWGESVVDRLRGIFAFAILDSRRGEESSTLLLARDRLGVKPLYYAWTAGSIVFASELRAMRASDLVSADPGPAALVGYLMLGSVPSPLTMYRDVHMMEPGSVMRVVLCDLSIRPVPRRYWRLPRKVEEVVSPEDARENVAALLKDAVRSQLVSDVPLGAFLSGGLDSSVLVALMRHATHGAIVTCSMVFEEEQYSEAPFAQAMADVVGSRHYERLVCASDVVDQWDRILDAMDQPTVDGINSYFVSETAREAGLTVSLSGLGADELFGGYPNTFLGVPRALRFLKLAGTMPGGGWLAGNVVRALPQHRRLSRGVDALHRAPGAANAYVMSRGLFSVQEIRQLLSPDLWMEGIAEFDPVRHVAERMQNGVEVSAGGSELFDWVSRAELVTYTSSQLLRDTDAMSMAHSLEVRVPFLDHRLVEYVVSLPSSLKESPDASKPLLRESAGPHLPELLRTPRAKQGFTFPFEVWVRGPLREIVESGLDAGVSGGWLNREATAQLARDYRNNRVHWSRLWGLSVLGSRLS